MSIDYALANKLHRKHKAALTRAKNTGNPHKLLAAANAYFDDFERNGLPLTDDWHRWNIARQDATFQIMREEPSW